MVYKKQIIGVLDTPFSNSKSIINVLKYLEFDSIKINDIKQMKNIEKIIIPGIGNFEKLSLFLKEKNFIEIIQEYYQKEKYLLTICLGFQILFSSSEESKNSEGLKYYPNKVKKFKSGKTHMGWNKINFEKNSQLYSKEDFDDKYFYFVHGYFVEKSNNDNFRCGLSTFENENFISYLEDKNFFGLQFHPEKSQKQGVKLIDKFCKL